MFTQRVKIHYNSYFCIYLKMAKWAKTLRNEYYVMMINFSCDFMVKVKVKCTLVQALRLCTGHTAQRGSRGIALPFHDHGTRRGWGVSVTPRPLFTPGKNPDTHCTGGWVGPRAGLDRCRKSRPPTGIRSPDHPAFNRSLYRLSYLAHCSLMGYFNTVYILSRWDY